MALGRGLVFSDFLLFPNSGSEPGFKREIHSCRNYYLTLFWEWLIFKQVDFMSIALKSLDLKALSVKENCNSLVSEQLSRN